MGAIETYVLPVYFFQLVLMLVAVMGVLACTFTYHKFIFLLFLFM